MRRTLQLVVVAMLALASPLVAQLSIPEIAYDAVDPLTVCLRDKSDACEIICEIVSMCNVTIKVGNSYFVVVFFLYRKSFQKIFVCCFGLFSVQIN